MRIGLDISVLNDSKRTGIGVYTYELIKALLEENKKDKFILFGFSTLSTFDYLKNIDLKNYPNVKIKIIKLPAKSFRSAFLVWQKLEFPKIEKFIGKIDIYHSFNWYLPPQKNGKTVATIFDLTSVLYPEWHQKKTSQLDKIRFERIKTKADIVIAISESAKRDFLNFSPKSKVKVVYPSTQAIFNKTFSKKLQQQILKKFNLKSKFILSAATLEPRKNLEGLIKAYLKSKVDIPLVLVGKMGWGDNRILKLTKKSKKIILTGFINDAELNILYHNALFFCYLSFYEGFGIPVLSALKSGTPVICSNTSSLPEVSGDAVLYVDPKNIDQIASAIKKLYKNTKLRKELSNKGLKQARKFSFEKSAKKLDKLYHSF